MGAPTVSIIVNNHDYERYLSAAIDSALAQTHDRTEVVVVDDGSTDGSREVIASYGDLLVPVLKPNGGQGSAFNAGFAASSGDIVLFLDADDVLDPQAAARVVELFASPDVALAMFRLRVVDAEGRPTGHLRPRRTGVMPDGDLRRHVVRHRCFHWQPTSGLAFARSALELVLPMPEDEYRISADAYLAGLVPLLGLVRSTDEVGGSYRVHGSSSYTDAAIDGRYFRGQIARIQRTHGHAARLGPAIGVDVPSDPRQASDAALLGFRLASLLLDPAEHPFTTDRRLALAVKGIGASVGNSQLAAVNRARRAAWFAAAGLLPRRWARRLAAERAPDTPARRARMVQGQAP